MEQQNGIKPKEEQIMIFNDGLVYRAHIRNSQPGLGAWQPSDAEFHAIVFYKETDKNYIIASHREYVPNSYKKGEIDKIVSQSGIEEICFNMLVGLLRNDPAKSWYQDKTFVLGEHHNESVVDYLKRNGNNADFANIITKELFTPGKN
jgi:hypothetical protein